MSSELQLPSNWVRTTLGEIADFIMGQAPPGSACNTEGNGTIFVKAGEFGAERPVVREWTTEPLKLGRHSDVFICVVGATAGKLNLGLDCAIGRSVAAIRPRSTELSNTFLLHQLTPMIGTLRKNSAGSAQGVISKSDLARIPIVLPPRGDRHRIVAEIEKQFTRLHAGVAGLKRVEAQLKRYRASVLKAACEGRLVPTEAELARREKRDYEPADKLLARILKERRARWEAAQLAKMKAAGKLPKDDKWKAKYVEPSSAKAAGLHPLPEGWAWARWEQVGFSQNGRPFPSKDYSESGTKLLRPGNMHVSGRLLWTTDNTRYMPESYATENPDLIVGGNELVINLTAQSLKDEFLGRVCLTPPDEHCLLNQRLARLTPVLLDQRFCLWLFKAWAFRRFVGELNTGSLIQHMFTTQIADFLVAMPPLAEQLRIAEEVERRLSVVEQLEMTTDAATLRSSALRAATLRCAFEGLLTPQATEDEPASKLLERISAAVENKPLPKQSRAKQATAVPKMKATR